VVILFFEENKVELEILKNIDNKTMLKRHFSFNHSAKIINERVGLSA
jgi:hypothetical protein